MTELGILPHVRIEARRFEHPAFQPLLVVRLPREIDWVYDLLKKYRSIEFAQARARELLDAAQSAFGSAFEGAQDGDDKAFVGRSIRYMIERSS